MLTKLKKDLSSVDLPLFVDGSCQCDEDYAGSSTNGVCSQQISPQLSALSDEVVSHDAQVNDWNIILDNFQSKLFQPWIKN